MMKRLNVRTIFIWSVMILTFITFAVATFFPIMSDDVFMYLALGKRFLAGDFPHTDPFLFSMPAFEWHTAHEWGSYILFYAAYLIDGYDSVIAFKVLVLTALAILSTWPLIRAKNFALALLIPVATYAGVLRLSEKASLFSDVFTVLVMAIILSQNFSKRRWLIVVPFLFLVWINIHPGSPIGFALLGLAFLNQLWLRDFKRAKLIAWGFAIALLVSLVNPIGWRGLYYPVERFFNPDWNIYRGLFLEWMPVFVTGFQNLFEIQALLLIFVLTVISLIANWRKKPFLEAALFFVMLYFGSSAVRFMLMASFGCLLILSHQIANMKVLRNSAGWAVGAVVQIALLIFIIGWGYPTYLGRFEVGGGLAELSIPYRAAEFIEQHHVEGNIFNETDWGSYLAWRWNGDRKVFYDGHIDDPKFLQNVYMKVFKTPADFDQIINDYKIEVILTRPRALIASNTSNKNLVSKVQSGDWKIVYADNMSLILVPRASPLARIP